MSTAPRLLRELFETLLIMAGDMLPFLSTEQSEQYSGTLNEGLSGLGELYALRTRFSVSLADKGRDKARTIRLRNYHAKAVSTKLAGRIYDRLGSLWQPVVADAINWTPGSDGNSTPLPEMHDSRRVLLFHIVAVMDVNECTLDFLPGSDSERKDYMKTLYDAIMREAIELEPSSEVEVARRVREAQQEQQPPVRVHHVRGPSRGQQLGEHVRQRHVPVVERGAVVQRQHTSPQVERRQVGRGGAQHRGARRPRLHNVLRDRVAQVAPRQVAEAVPPRQRL
ncbi:hypothetical protein FGB62_206g09 [Gracilaria domingensis]|nr:hypothetical protein FGB62_206g09 [Gracilaria domingensis]